MIYCQVDQIDFDSVSNQFYVLFKAAHEFRVGPFRQTPTCLYDLDYTFTYKRKDTADFLPLPDWITATIDNTVSPPQFDLSVQTDTKDNEGDYIISIHAQVNEMFMDPPPYAQMLIDLEVFD